jgi:3-phenylpropionate/cinnamic acid dioxygenase small subunit
VSDALDVTDRLAIEDLIVAYAGAMDTRDWALFRSCFLPDARTTMDRVGEFASCDAVIELYAPRFESFAALQHFVTNVAIRGSGNDATARTNFVSHHVPKGGAAYTYGGTFDFDLVRRPEGWRISAHTIRILWDGGTPRRVGSD